MPEQRSRACRRLPAALLVGVALSLFAVTGSATPQARESLVLRGHPQSLYLYGTPTGDPVIVSSGDGGWVHLGPHVAEYLGAHGYYVVGFDVRAYLESFTGSHGALGPSDEPKDYSVLTEFARHATGRKPVLIGVSEGAGLSVLAATDPRTKSSIAGVVGLGLPDMNELGWRWKDAVIYLTHRVPNEPLFSAASLAAQVAPVPLAAIHSTHDEFVSLADVHQVMDAAREPKRLWVISASDHRFSDNLDAFDGALVDALSWVKAHQAS